jgi:hypothetical protein
VTELQANTIWGYCLTSSFPKKKKEKRYDEKTSNIVSSIITNKWNTNSPICPKTRGPKASNCSLKSRNYKEAISYWH